MNDGKLISKIQPKEKLIQFTDCSGQEQYRIRWLHHFENTKCVVYCVDATGDAM